MMCSNDEDEFDVDMTPDTEVSGDAALERLGVYPSMEAFLRSQVEHLLHADGLWLMTCIDLDKVLKLLEGGVYRIWRDDSGRVLRRRWPQPPA